MAKSKNIDITKDALRNTQDRVARLLKENKGNRVRSKDLLDVHYVLADVEHELPIDRTAAVRFLNLAMKKLDNLEREWSGREMADQSSSVAFERDREARLARLRRRMAEAAKVRPQRG